MFPGCRLLLTQSTNSSSHWLLSRGGWWEEMVFLGSAFCISLDLPSGLPTAEEHREAECTQAWREVSGTTNATGHVFEDELQKAISNFYIIYNLVLSLSPLLTAYGLAKLGDKKNRKIPICFPLLGYLVSRSLLLLLILLEWPIEVMYGAAALNGLTGGFTTYWAGIMALGALGSTESRRSLRLIVIELVYGMAGFLGSIVSGHLFVRFNVSYRRGTVLVACSIACYVFCLLYSVFVLKIPKPDGTCPASTAHSKPKDLDHLDRHTHLAPSKLIIAMLFLGAVLYDLAVAGAMDVLPLFLLRKPLSWGPVDIGYGNAAGYAIFITSFLGVYVFSKYLRDTTMIIMGILSFTAGVFIMAFVRWTFLFYIGNPSSNFEPKLQTPKQFCIVSKRVHSVQPHLFPPMLLALRKDWAIPSIF
uniref:Solute carrier family 46 member 2 n=1 Tax=Pelusios castaneus TaxID=367368 RepID=A0A8C8RLN2_9SAUR